MSCCLSLPKPKLPQRFVSRHLIWQAVRSETTSPTCEKIRKIPTRNGLHTARLGVWCDIEIKMSLDDCNLRYIMYQFLSNVILTNTSKKSNTQLLQLSPGLCECWAAGNCIRWRKMERNKLTKHFTSHVSKFPARSKVWSILIHLEPILGGNI